MEFFLKRVFKINVSYHTQPDNVHVNKIST